MLTPYRAAVNRELGGYYRERGLDVLNVSGFDMDDDYAMTDIAPEAIVAAGIRATAADADALFISCTALRASEAVERIEQAIGRPVITSNQAVIWHALHLMQLAAPTQAPGRLFNATRVR